jgi:hypothetical protein
LNEPADILLLDEPACEAHDDLIISEVVLAA